MSFSSAVVLGTAWAINDTGWIVGQGDRRFDGATFPNQRAYLLTPFETVLGDMDGNGVVDAFDVDDFELALADKAAYIDTHFGLDPDVQGDINASGALNAFDVAGFEALLASGGMSTPEPATIVLLALAAPMLHRSRRSPRTYP